MNHKSFNFWNRLGAVGVLLVSAITYLLTIEPSASFWDCGEFIASSYKLEVGHPPGNPLFQLIARFFTLFGDKMHAAVLVNAMSAICSALTIFLLYLTIVWLVKRIVRPLEGEYSPAQTIAIIGSGVVGSLAYCFSDTFWFSAVEGEVYAMSSLFTALVFWAMTKWYDIADEPHANRWIVLIAFLMGLSIGVHLLNLLAIPALVFMFYYRRNENKNLKTKDFLKIFGIGVVILAIILFIIIPVVPKLAAYVDLFFVNVLSLPYNSGAAFFVLALLGLCFWGVYKTLKKGKVFLNTALLCLTTILIGFSVFSFDVIRSCAKTPTNEYQPDNAFTLVRYLSREQYGSTPLIYGQYYGAPYEAETGSYWAPVNGKYKKVASPVQAKYKPEGKMLFPRMWSDSPDGRYEEFYKSYTQGKGRLVPGAKEKRPSMGANLAYFFDYQMNWMYWRYFMWNFAGRQNEIHSPTPGNPIYGNWECGIGFIDKARLGDQSNAPEILSSNKGKNHYFLIPLILGLIGLFFQYGRDRRGCWLTFLMFFMTGIAIVLYLNQPPYQVRERDYAYAGSFYFFSAWIGIAVAAIYTWISDALKGRRQAVVAAATAVACLSAPVLMAQQNWDDHDRSNRYTAVELARNYLNSVGENGILITHGDNDTFPLWYAQEVEEYRNDVRICNTSLLGTDWHIDQMTWASNNSPRLDLRVPHEMYLYGTNEIVPIYDTRNQVMSIKDVMTLYRHPDVKLSLSSGNKCDYIASRRISVPVNKENVIKSGILDAKYADQIPDQIILTIPEGKDYLSKPDIFMLDLLSNYQWDRPINFLSYGGDINVGIKDYLEFQGYSHKLIPIRNHPESSDQGFVDPDNLYRLMTHNFSWDNLARDDYFVDYQNNYTTLGVVSVRSLFLSCADVFMKTGHADWALEMLDKSLYATRSYSLDGIPLGFTGNNYMVVGHIGNYYTLGQRQKAEDLAMELGEKLIQDVVFYRDFYDLYKEDFETATTYIYYLVDIMKTGGSAVKALELLTSLNNALGE